MNDNVHRYAARAAVDLSVKTTAGETFTEEEHRALARLLFKRWGNDRGAFCAVWRRLFQNNADDAAILTLLD